MLRVVAAATITMGAFVGAYSTTEEVHETAQMFKVSVGEDDVRDLERSKKEYQKYRLQYFARVEGSEAIGKLQGDYNDLVQTAEFKTLATEIQDFEHGKLTAAQKQELQQFLTKYNAQRAKTEAAFEDTKRHTTSEIEGEKERAEAKRKHDIEGEPLPPDYYEKKPKVTLYDIDNDKWIAANREYFKLKAIAVEVFKLDAIKQIQWKMRSVRQTSEAKKLFKDWKDFTHEKDYQLLMSEEAKLILKALNLIRVDQHDRILSDPKCSPPVYDVFHFVYIYFKAVAEGDVDPLLDFISDGKFHDDFVEVVKFDKKCFETFEEDRRKHIENEARKAIQDQIDQELEKKRRADELKWRQDKAARDVLDEIIRPERLKLDEKRRKEAAAKKKATQNAEKVIDDIMKKNPNYKSSLILLI